MRLSPVERRRLTHLAAWAAEVLADEEEDRLLHPERDLVSALSHADLLLLAAARRDVAVPWSICSDDLSKFAIGQVKGARKLLGDEAKDIADIALVRAVETYRQSHGATPETWGRKLAMQSLIKALDHKRAERDYHKRLQPRQRGRKRKTTLNHDDPPTPVARFAIRESPGTLLRNATPDGFALRCVPHATTCQGLHSPAHTHVVSPGADHMHRPAHHHLGYAVLCCGCFERLRTFAAYQAGAPDCSGLSKSESTKHWRSDAQHREEVPRDL